MKLSEAMFKGIEGTNPIHGEWMMLGDTKGFHPDRFDPNEGNKPVACHACAVGAIYFGMTNGQFVSEPEDMARVIPELQEKAVCPVQCRAVISTYLDNCTCEDIEECICNEDGEPRLLDVCSHLYETHRWTRAAIAMWLEERERAKMSQVPAEAAAAEEPVEEKLPAAEVSSNLSTAPTV
jgi:hypothetical protein